MSEQKRNGTGTSRSLFGQKEEILFNQSLSETGTMGCKKLVVKNHPNADALNRLIYEFVAAIEKKNWNYGSRANVYHWNY